MSIRLLKTLIAVSEEGTFGAAADIVFVSHAAVSQQMKQLELELQVSLFDRSKRSPQLNSLGRAMVLKAREVVNSYENMVTSLLGEENMMGEFTLGAMPTSMTELVPRAITFLKESYPGLHVRVVPGLSGELLPQVERGSVDAAIMSEPSSGISALNWNPFAVEPLVVLVAASIASDDPVYLLENHPYIRFTRRAWVGMQVDNWLQKKNIKVRESMELETLESISSMVSHNLGVSIIPKSCVAAPDPLKVKQIPLDHTASPRILGVISRKDTVKYKIIEMLAERLRICVEEASLVEAIHG